MYTVLNENINKKTKQELQPKPPIPPPPPPPQPLSLASSTLAKKRTIEWESTVTIPIDEETFNSRTQFCKLDIIFLFENGLRLAQRHIQKKTTTYSRNLLNFYHGHWFAIERTTALEELMPINETDGVPIQQIIYRCINYHNTTGIRISYNKISTAMGVQYNVEFEIEYPCNSKYLEILRHERTLMQCIIDHGYKVKRDIMTLETMFAYVMTKVQMWHNYNVEDKFLWAYKWNGVKAKMLITDKILENGARLTYLWPDAKATSTEHCFGDNLDILLNLCLLVEIMDDKIVLIEAIGSMVDNKIYTTEPMANASILKHFNSQLNNVRINDKPLIVQKFYDGPLPKEYDKTQYDGLIIIQNDINIKWKIPTIDVKCIKPHHYTVGGEVFILENMPGEVGAIYEISHTYEVLRKRTDRIAASTLNEYAIFLESSERIKAQVIKPTMN